MNEVIVIRSKRNGKNYRVAVPDDQTNNFEETMKRNGWRFTETGEYKMNALIIDMDTEIQKEK